MFFIVILIIVAIIVLIVLASSGTFRKKRNCLHCERHNMWRYFFALFSTKLRTTLIYIEIIGTHGKGKTKSEDTTSGKSHPFVIQYSYQEGFPLE